MGSTVWERRKEEEEAVNPEFTVCPWTSKTKAAILVSRSQREREGIRKRGWTKRGGVKLMKRRGRRSVPITSWSVLPVWVARSGLWTRWGHFTTDVPQDRRSGLQAPTGQSCSVFCRYTSSRSCYWNINLCCSGSRWSWFPLHHVLLDTCIYYWQSVRQDDDSLHAKSFSAVRKIQLGVIITTFTSEIIFQFVCKLPKIIHRKLFAGLQSQNIHHMRIVGIFLENDELDFPQNGGNMIDNNNVCDLNRIR